MAACQHSSERLNTRATHIQCSSLSTRTTDRIDNGPTHVHEEDGVVNVQWGGALVGYWGFSVAVNGGKLYLPSEPNTKALRLSDDILVVSEPD